MKISIFIAVLSELHVLAASHSLLLRGASVLKEGAAPPVATGADRFTGDPALAIVAGSSGGDYYTQAWTGENSGDPKRGTGACTAFRRTLQCNPSGPRDPKQDKGCQQVIDSDESGFCECGDFAQFAAVNCNHRPFTCEVMCVKFAVVTGKTAFYRNQKLSPAEAKILLDKVMWANQTDLEAMRMMSMQVKDFMDRALQHTTDTADQAKVSMKKFLDMMKVAREHDADAAAKEMENYRNMVNDHPWIKIYENGGKMIDAGRGIQAKVREILPFDPLTAAQDQASNRN